MNDSKQHEKRPDPLLGMSAGELKLLRYTIVTFTAAALICLLALVFWVLSQIAAALQVLVFPLAVAGVLALILFPLVEAFETYLRFSRLTAVVTLFLIISLLLLVGLVLVVPIAVRQGSELASSLPGMIEQAYSSLLARFPTLIPLIENVLAGIEPQAILPEPQEAADRTMGYISLIVGMGFVPLYLFFALLSGERIRYHAKSLLFIFHVETQDEVLYLGQVFVDYMTAFFRGQLSIALSMGVIMAAGFTIIGLNGAIFFGMALGLLSIVPYLGMIIGLFTVLPVAYIQPDGGFQLALLVLGVIIITQIIESILLTPKIMADKSGLHPVLVVVSILFWGTVLGGITGMILAVPLTAFLLTLGRHLRLRLFRPGRPGVDPPA
jgi:predicted PurR-regulated permease PerM